MSNIEWTFDLISQIAKFIDDSVSWYYFSCINRITRIVSLKFQDQKMDCFAKYVETPSNWNGRTIGFKEENFLPNGTKHGVCRYLRSDGLETEREEFKNGKRHGKHLRRMSNGELFVSAVFKEGELVETEYQKSWTIYTEAYRGAGYFFCREQSDYQCNQPIACYLRRRLNAEIEIAVTGRPRDKVTLRQRRKLNQEIVNFQFN